MNICSECVNYVYNEEIEDYECLVNLDEDEYMRMMTSKTKECPYFRADDEYAIARKQ